MSIRKDKGTASDIFPVVLPEEIFIVHRTLSLVVTTGAIWKCSILCII